MQKHLIEIAYEFVKSNFNKSPFTFKELIDGLTKKNKDVSNLASDLYIDLLQDIRFISLGKQKWSLRENFTLNEINKITSSMFGLDEYLEEDADKYMSEIEKNERLNNNYSEHNFLEDYIDEENTNEFKGLDSSKDDDQTSADSKINLYDDNDEDVDDVEIDDSDLIDDENLDEIDEE